MPDPINLILPRLESVRKTGPSSWTARCPAHQDKSPSLSIREAADGRVLIYCFGGCGATDVVLALGLDLADLFPPRQTTTYAPTRVRDRDLPRIPAADALKLLDKEAFYVQLAADALAEGANPAPYREDLRAACSRICEIRHLWEMQP